MSRSVRLLAALFVFAGQTAAWPQDKASTPRKKIPDGVYAVLRESLKEKDVLPLKEGEVLVVHHSRYLKKDEKEPPHFLVVHCRCACRDFSLRCSIPSVTILVMFLPLLE